DPVPTALSVHPPKVVLRGSRDRQQFLATGTVTGREVDLTRGVEWSVQPEGIIAIDSTGVAVGLANGKATITAQKGDVKATAEIEVRDFDTQVMVDFDQDVQAVLTR